MALLKNGVKQAPGGKRKGAGRYMNWQKELCEKLIYDRKLIPRLADCADGKEIFTFVDKQGVKHDVPADAAVQVMATDRLMDRAWGKARQEMEVKGAVWNLTDLLAMALSARQERGLADE